MFTFTNGRGNAIYVGHTESDAVSILLDEYGLAGPGVTLSLHRDTGRCEITDTDDGCAMRFVASDYDVTIVLPISIVSLRTELDLATDDRVRETTSDQLEMDDPWNPVEQGMYDDDPNPYHGTYSED